jgi:hypothetical protein
MVAIELFERAHVARNWFIVAARVASSVCRHFLFGRYASSFRDIGPSSDGWTAKDTAAVVVAARQSSNGKDINYGTFVYSVGSRGQNELASASGC